jgi:16S rRNA (uracil1498-N3)-methyltransferase
MHRFYCQNITNDIALLSEEESAHAIRVLRLQIGDTIILLDGFGNEMQAVIIDNNAKKCVLKLNGIRHFETAPKSKLHIAIAPTKNIDRIEWFVEKATEIGICSITPIITAQSANIESAYCH